MRSLGCCLLFLLYYFSSCKGFLSEKRSCNENPQADKLLIFVGEKIEVNEMEPDQSSDSFALPYAKFKARYKVLEVVCGEYNKKEITFIAYDHYGVPAFEQYKHVVLYVYNYKDTFYHERYLFDAMYKTKDGEWASPVSWFNYDFEDSITNKIKPRKIEYEKEVSFDVKGLSRKALENRYPTPYYSIQKKRAIAMYGNYLEEVVQLKKDGVLKARGYYGNFDSANKVKVQDVTLEEIKPGDEIQVNKPAVARVAYTFFELLKKWDTASIRKMSFDSVVCSVCEEPPRSDYENNLETLDSFFISARKYLPFSQVWLEIENRVYQVSATTEIIYEKQAPFKKSHEFQVYKISFTTIEDFDGYRAKQSNDFEFVLVNGKYKFYGMRTKSDSYKSVRSY